LIYLSLVGFGLDGPYDARPVYEDILQSLTAVPTMLTRTGARVPMFVPVTYNDRACGLSAANIILAALLARCRTGRGQHVVMPMFETMAQFVLGDHMGGRTYDPPIGPMGYMRVLSELRRPFATADGFICLVLYTDLHWRAFLSLVGKEEWLVDDPRLQSITQRAEHAHEIYKPVAEMLRLKTSAEWLALLEAADIPCAPVHTLDTLLEDEHLRATGFLHSVEHPSEGRITQMGIPSRWSDTQPTLRRLAPQLGEHSAEILRELGLSDSEIRQLMDSRVSQAAQNSPLPVQP
jgi:crotonobetainyl-CoA:carnitine CoA-transferase CaiB-like acyl-CoA transferase